MAKENNKRSNTPRNRSWLILAVIAGVLMLGEVFYLLFTGYKVVTGSTTFAYELFLNTLIFLALYFIYYKSKQKYLSKSNSRNPKQFKKIVSGSDLFFRFKKSIKPFTKTHAALVVVTSVATLALFWQVLEAPLNKKPLSTAQPTTDIQMEWQKFIKDKSSTTYYNVTPFYEDSSSQGCFKDSEISKADGCSFTNSELYALDGDYQENVKKILSYLLDHGYEFQKNEGIQHDLEYYSNREFLSFELEESKQIKVPMKEANSDTRLFLEVNAKPKQITYLGGKRVPQSTLDNIPSGSMIYELRIYEVKKL